MLIDFEFGLSQLGGNESLLISLLMKVHTEYMGTDERLQNFFDTNQWDKARTLVHTLKGVSGNLGCVDLHQTCRTLDYDLKDADYIPRSFADFKVSLNETLNLIEQANQQGSVSISQTNDNAVSPFVMALQDNAFITPDELQQFLASLDASPEDKNAIEGAVNDMDYKTALTILSRY